MKKYNLDFFKYIFYCVAIIFVFIGAKPKAANDSIIQVIHFKFKSTCLDSSRLNEYYNIIQYLNKPDFASKYKITYSPYNSKSEFLFDKKIALKRYRYLQKLFKRDVKTKCKIAFKNINNYVSENDDCFALTGLFFELHER